MKKQLFVLLTLTCCMLAIAGCGTQKTPATDSSKNNDSTKMSEEATGIKVLLDGEAPSKEAPEKEEEAIRALVYQWNKHLLTTLYTGNYKEWPEKNCDSPAICNRFNTLLQQSLKEKGPIGKNVEHSYFNVQFNQVLIHDDIAKVVITRTADVLYKNQPNTVQYGQEEGYILKKIDGQWHFNNIILSSANAMDTFNAFKNTDQADDIATTYTYEHFPAPNEVGTITIPRDPTAQTS